MKLCYAARVQKTEGGAEGGRVNMPRSSLEVTRVDRVRIKYIRETAPVRQFGDKLKKTRRIIWEEVGSVNTVSNPTFKERHVKITLFGNCLFFLEQCADFLFLLQKRQFKRKRNN